MFAYLILLALCTPSILLALNMSLCPRTPEQKNGFPFNPARNRCDANYVLACLLACLSIAYVAIWLMQNTVPTEEKPAQRPPADPMAGMMDDPFASFGTKGTSRGRGKMSDPLLGL